MIPLHIYHTIMEIFMIMLDQLCHPHYKCEILQMILEDLSCIHLTWI